MHPIIFTFPDWIPLLGGAHIYSYGVMLGIGFISAWYLGMHFTLREGFSYKKVTAVYALAIVFALIGARVAHLICNPETWKFERGFIPALFASRCEGLVAYGGYIGGVFAAWVYLRLKKLDFWSLCDGSTPSLALGLGFTRIGCLLAGCCHGQPTDLPWGVSFPPGSQAAGTFPGIGGYSACVHPTQIYESLVGFALVPLGIYILKRRKFTGQAFLIMIACYAVARFLLEFIRGDNDRGGFGGSHAAPMLSASQFIGLVLLLVALLLYLWRWKTAPKPPEPRTKEEINEMLIAEGVAKGKDKKGKKTAKAADKSSKKSKKKKKSV
ncbi:MAG TPA: prolipoprotein diacylglyceryl transferase [Myxococcota bacterium]|nr:prolipoprotein diacylglyceryl transferase [Myxococcota bacterium]